MRTRNQLCMILVKILSLVFLFGLPCKSSQPNIIFIVADDLGWNDVSFHGSKQIPTPNIDILAYDGIILNNYYASPICSPSRGSLMTGKYALNIGLQHNIIGAGQPWGLPLEEKILPQYLKKLGYVTRGIGKWHLGFFESDYLPTRRGFDSFIDTWTGFVDYYTYVHNTVYGEEMSGYDFHVDEETAGRNYSENYLTELYTEMAKNIIRNHNYTQGKLRCLHSLAARILLKNYGLGIIEKLSATKNKKLIVDCQLEKGSVRQSCRLSEGPCLFDLEKDPCEYNNIAKNNPEIVRELQSLLFHYQSKAVPPGNKPGDPQANPKFHNNAFVPLAIKNIIFKVNFIYLIEFCTLLNPYWFVF